MRYIKNPEHPHVPICKYLRAKASYVPDMQNEHYMEIHYPYDQFYCLKTLHNVGPDDDIVCPEDCLPQRVCYEPLPVPILFTERDESGVGSENT